MQLNLALLPSGDYLVSLLLILSSFLIAACTFWSSPLVNWLSSPKSPFQLDYVESNWIIAGYLVSCLVFVLPLAYLTNRIGRKKTLFIAYPTAIASFVLALFVETYVTILVVRLLHGVSLAVLLTVVPLFAGETLKNEVRGVVIAGFMVSFSAASLIFGVLGTYLEYRTYCGICLIVPLVGVAVIFLLTESPHYLIMKNDREKALEALKWLRGSENVEDEMNMIEKNVQEEMALQRGYKYLIKSPEERKTLALGLVITIGGSIIGYPVIPVYAFTLFPPDMSSIVSSTTMGFILNGLTVLGTCAIALLVERVGRRPLLLVSALANAVFSLLTAIYLSVESLLPPTTYYVLLVFIVLFTFFIAWIQSLQVITQAELFTSNTRSESCVILQFFAAFFSLIALLVYPVINEYWGAPVNFFLFSLYSTLFFLFLWFYMPETAGQFIGHKVNTRK